MVEKLRGARTFLLVAKMQSWVRRYLGYIAYKRLVLEHNGKIIKAARMIMRAWVNYRLTQKYVFILDSHKIMLLGKKLEKLEKHRKSLVVDVQDIHADIVRAEKVTIVITSYCRTYLQLIYFPGRW